MRGSRSRISSVYAVGAVIVGLFASACGNNTTNTNDIYVRFECGKCHGQNREGARTAPPLTELASRWSETGLVEYMQDPQQVTRETPRITLRNEQYPLKMPSYAAAAESDLENLARFLLND